MPHPVPPSSPLTPQHEHGPKAVQCTRHRGQILAPAHLAVLAAQLLSGRDVGGLGALGGCRGGRRGGALRPGVGQAGSGACALSSLQAGRVWHVAQNGAAAQPDRGRQPGQACCTALGKTPLPALPSSPPQPASPARAAPGRGCAAAPGQPPGAAAPAPRRAATAPPGRPAGCARRAATGGACPPRRRRSTPCACREGGGGAGRSHQERAKRGGSRRCRPCIPLHEQSMVRAVPAQLGSGAAGQVRAGLLGAQ